MDQVKIGVYIAEKRKQLGLTQQQLANRLGVTDRAISKWENGRGMPELGLIQPLCRELGITVNEFFCGETIPDETLKQKSEEGVANTLTYSQLRVARSKRMLTAALAVIAVLLVCGSFFIGIPINSLTTGASLPTTDAKQLTGVRAAYVQHAIADYIEFRGDAHKHRPDAKTFAAVQLYSVTGAPNDPVCTAYAWVLEEQYYTEGNNLVQDSGSSIPYRFTLQQTNDTYTVINAEIPRDGSYYPKDIKNMFPKWVQKRILSVHNDGTVERLGLEINSKAKLYFEKHD